MGRVGPGAGCQVRQALHGLHYSHAHSLTGTSRRFSIGRAQVFAGKTGELLTNFSPHTAMLLWRETSTCTTVSTNEAQSSLDTSNSFTNDRTLTGSDIRDQSTRNAICERTCSPNRKPPQPVASLSSRYQTDSSTWRAWGRANYCGPRTSVRLDSFDTGHGMDSPSLPVCLSSTFLLLAASASSRLASPIGLTLSTRCIALGLFVE